VFSGWRRAWTANDDTDGAAEEGEAEASTATHPRETRSRAQTPHFKHLSVHARRRRHDEDWQSFTPGGCPEVRASALLSEDEQHR
jgi:hypothetical protein